MRQTLFRVTDSDGNLLDRADCLNCPDIADQRIARVLKYHPDAIVKREDFTDQSESQVRANHDRFDAEF